MPTYISALNQMLGVECARLPRAVLYGENISNGSRIVGMCRSLKTPEGGRILNVGNCEATHIGVGFGLMLNGVSAVLFAKQLDFMLLGVDHFVNTFNFIRSSCPMESMGAFTIVAIVCDQGHQGPQSSFNSLGDLCSLARVPGYTLTNRQDAEQVLRCQLSKPGFRIIGLSQRLFASELFDPGLVWVAKNQSVFQYTIGHTATIACSNFALPEGLALLSKLQGRGLGASLFSVNHVPELDCSKILNDVKSTGRLVLIDDSKSVNLCAHRVLNEVAAHFPRTERYLVSRENEIAFGVDADSLAVDSDYLLSRLSSTRAA